MGDENPEKYSLTPAEGEALEHSHGFTGRGVAAYTNGDSYDGGFKDGQKHGAGVYTYKNGNKFEGRYVNNAKSTTAVGRFTFAAPATEDGDEDGDRHGGRYIGRFGADGKFGGEGTMVYANGDVYAGGWAGGKKHGFGRYLFKNTASATSDEGRRGYSYEGEWAGGRMTSGRWVLQAGDSGAGGDSLSYNAEVIDQVAKAAGGNGADGYWARKKLGIWFQGEFGADGAPAGEGAWHFGAGHMVVGSFSSAVRPRHGGLTKAETQAVRDGTFADEEKDLSWTTAGVVGA